MCEFCDIEKNGNNWEMSSIFINQSIGIGLCEYFVSFSSGMYGADDTAPYIWITLDSPSETILTEKRYINYCPFCGRKLEENI